jgi:hypothetical protein
MKTLRCVVMVMAMGVMNTGESLVIDMVGAQKCRVHFYLTRIYPFFGLLCNGYASSYE